MDVLSKYLAEFRNFWVGLMSFGLRCRLSMIESDSLKYL